jgi:hypothetical protein
MSRHNSPIAILAFGAVQTHNDGVLISSTREAGRKFQTREKVPAGITIEKKRPEILSPAAAESAKAIRVERF